MRLKKGLFSFILMASHLVLGLKAAVKEPVLEFPLDFNVEMKLRNFSAENQVEFRYHSFGNTKLTVLAKFDGNALRQKNAAKLTVTSAISKQGVTVQTFSPRGQSNDGWLKYEITLDGAGLYHLIPSSKHLILKVTCHSGCGRSEISLQEALDKLSDSDLKIFAEAIELKLKLRLPKNEKWLFLLRGIAAQILEKNHELLARFPILPAFSDLGEKRKLLTLGGERAAPSHVTPRASWNEQRAGFEASPPPEPEEIDPRLPHIRYGHFISDSLPPRMVAENQALAVIMTALAEQNGYSVEFPAGPRATQEVKNLSELLELLFETGHHIELRDERTAANFLSFTAGDKYVRWPVWMRTGMFFEENEEFLLPVPHSQYVWQITGPAVNARVNFYLGIHGVGFFPKFDEDRPQWTGMASSTQIDDSTAEGKAQIIKATLAASSYLRRIHVEYQRHAKTYPADGYGYLGVCNDSAALIERVLFNKTTLYPLLRAPELRTISKIHDGLTQFMEKLPYDSLPMGMLNGGPGTKDEILSRIVAMITSPSDSQLRWDEEYFSQVDRARRLLIQAGK